MRRSHSNSNCILPSKRCQVNRQTNSTSNKSSSTILAVPKATNTSVITWTAQSNLCICRHSIQYVNNHYMHTCIYIYIYDPHTHIQHLPPNYAALTLYCCLPIVRPSSFSWLAIGRDNSAVKCLWRKAVLSFFQLAATQALLQETV